MPDNLHRDEHQERFRRGVEQFNARLFFEAHETWEEIWLVSAEPEKAFLQGIIQVAAAFHHYSRGNMRGTRSLLEAGLKRLERFPAVHRQLALESLRVEARAWVEEITDEKDSAADRLPKIVYVVNE
jgi:predicted metal-dependent hydrolase